MISYEEPWELWISYPIYRNKNTHASMLGHTQNKMMRVCIIVESIIIMVGLATKYIS